MFRKRLPKGNWLTLLLRYKRTFFYTLILLVVCVGHYYLMQLSLESFRYIRQSVLSMLCVLCLGGAFMLWLRRNGVRSRSLFVFLMFMVGLTNLLSLINGLTTGYAGVVNYKFVSLPMLIYGSIYEYIFLLYPIEAFRPGWLSAKRAVILFLPTIVVLGVYLLFAITTTEPMPVIDNWSVLLQNFWSIHVWIRLFILTYPIIGLVIMLRYRNNYKEWCENNYASMENMDVKWLQDYIYGNLVITISCEIVVLSNDARSVLMHNIIFLFFFLYGFYRVLFQKNPYPEGYFKEGMDAAKEELGVANELDEYAVAKYGFSNNIPAHKYKLEQWMEAEKPYLRKDFKLTDVMDVLPLNRSYLSRLFNEGYGVNFYQFVTRYRIEEGKSLLQSRPDLNITNIADLSGFSSISVFGKAFAQETGCTPKQWRDKEVKLKQ
ncbi:helix-turn-helix domain-containing protein [Massilibacteroides vaginae]|uniref:helix-turn-helix domain-containing protein n=1 Tax=Massilibacteroides vaginae TaxID=1673718 RepID=UPI001FEBA682|nr:AraC family transcriptional regulator [Massilibacteroides vaginae]